MMNSKIKEKKLSFGYVTCIFILIVLTLSSLIFSFYKGFDNLASGYVSDVSTDLLSMIICLFLLISTYKDKPWDKHNRCLFRLIFVLFLMFNMDFASSYLEGIKSVKVATLILNTLELFAETLLVYCFFAYIREELKLDDYRVKLVNNICRLVLLLDLLVDILNIKFGFFFSVNSNGNYVEGNLAECVEISTFIIYFITILEIIREKKSSVTYKLTLMTFFIFPMCSHILFVIFDIYKLINPAYLVSTLFIYINVFAMRNKKIAEQQVTLSKQSTQLMISQIQPHFLYNTLTTISNLCVTDPEEAEETTILFAQYLRTNLDSLRKTEPVSFKAEMGHISTYVELEKKRFGEKLNVEMDIEDTDFVVPSLGLQPIVENSIKHGIRGKDSPGHLKISSHKVKDGHEVIIEDDGIGFDLNAPAKEDGRSHVGMQNVRSRLEQMCNASMTIETSPGNGCKTTIIFPDNQE